MILNGDFRGIGKVEVVGGPLYSTITVHGLN